MFPGVNRIALFGVVADLELKIQAQTDFGLGFKIFAKPARWPKRG